VGWVGCRCRGLSRAMALRVAKSVGRSLSFSAIERAVEIHLWTHSRPWVRQPTGEYLSRRPAQGHASDVASPTEDSVVLFVVEIQDTQTAKGAFGSVAVADKVSDADASMLRSQRLCELRSR
jgi:hypothetical protein